MSSEQAISARGPLWIGAVASVILVFGFGVWAAAVPIDGAVLAVGEVDAAEDRHVIQHAEGGVVDEVTVREGHDVEVGQPLIRLRDANVEMEWALVNAQMAEVRARSLRLTAERDGTDWPTTWFETLDPQHSEAMLNQRRLFRARATTLQRQIEQLNHRRDQTEAQFYGLDAQDEALAIEAELLTAELAQQRELQRRGLTQTSRVTALEREAIRLQGRRAALSSQMSELQGRMADIGLQIETLRASRREEAISQLADAGVQLVELASHRAALAQRRAQLQIRAPVSGVVHGMAPLAEGVVLRPGEPLMQILEHRQTPRLVFRVRPQDIDNVHRGQSATVQFPGFDSTLAGLGARVTTISAATFQDERTGISFFRVEMDLTPEALRAIGDLPILPGLAAQAFLSTGARTPLAYFLSPITEQLNRAMREP